MYSVPPYVRVQIHVQVNNRIHDASYEQFDKYLGGLKYGVCQGVDNKLFRIEKQTCQI